MQLTRATTMQGEVMREFVNLHFILSLWAGFQSTSPEVTLSSWARIEPDADAASEMPPPPRPGCPQLQPASLAHGLRVPCNTTLAVEEGLPKHSAIPLVGVSAGVAAGASSKATTSTAASSKLLISWWWKVSMSRTETSEHNFGCSLLDQCEIALGHYTSIFAPLALAEEPIAKEQGLLVLVTRPAHQWLLSHSLPDHESVESWGTLLGHAKPT
eukprot:CAMPEP_0172693714 /NCGR_PEP_ID=MMETSP1074-20121228/26187_1 /TAXON_ID=2916 /ORGANISM="Ceratium fusus, Strain PA161109" /LENGTH=213 /DNA_ID=CAMNT_0013514131 /DNA_START=783 /DNA_END=1422 /DNA_ORIENTATION=-